MKFNLTGAYILCSPSFQIYTLNPALPRAQCLAVHNSRITDVGDLDTVVASTHQFSSYLPQYIQSWIPTSIPVITLDGKSAVYPGFADAHAHIIENGYMLQLPLVQTRSLQEIIDALKSYLLAHPDILNDKLRWIEGMGWDQTKWGQGDAFPTAADLTSDPLLADRLVSLSRIDGHAKWVSPAVLDLMGDLPKEIEGGQIIRDKEGNPTGVFLDKAMSLIPSPPWSQSQLEEYFNTTISLALQYGLTSIHDADTNEEFVNFYKKLADEGKLPIRLYLMAYSPSPSISNLTRLVDYGIDRRLNMRSVKLFADGALGSWGAALLEPYTDNPSTSGIMQTSPEALKALVEGFWEEGWQTNIHCIGDRANRVVLDIFEETLLKYENKSVEDFRPRIEHAQIFEKRDLDRVGRLGVITSVQPTHATSDMWYAETRLGPERIKCAYAYQSLLQASPHKILPLGSDFPVEGVNPLLGFYAAVSRLSIDGQSPHGENGWYPKEALTRTQALKGMTYDPAYASFKENDLGSLERGKKADFVVLDRDIMSEADGAISGRDVVVGEENNMLSWEEGDRDGKRNGNGDGNDRKNRRKGDGILDVIVRATVVDGEVVYGSMLS